jgi:CheY-like chemotaxis protein
VLLIRAIVAMVQRHELTEQLALVHEQITRTTDTLNKLIHDLATPLGVVVGMTQVLLSENNGLNEDGRECLEDVAREALRASEILKRVSEFERQASVLSSPAARVRDVTAAQRREPPNMIVLIADDDSASRQLVQATLASEEYRVIEAANGEDAWRLIRQRRPAVAILDWEMPVYSGLELADVIKGDPQLRDTTVILLTGRSAAADREAGAQARADVYLTKPFSPQELVEAVENALSLK